MTKSRAESAFDARVAAATKARERHHPDHRANPDEQRYAAAHYPMSFTKGLKHNNLGVVADGSHFEAFRNAIDEGYVEPFTSRVPVPDGGSCGRRRWEAPTAGTAYDLQGPDAQAVTMPPAPQLCSDELAYEMAEVYELALLRDVAFEKFATGATGADANKINASVGRLNALPYPIDGSAGRSRVSNGGALDLQTAFRGSSPGVDKGPYLSQFMLIGNGDLEKGKISYGAQQIDQRVPEADTGVDHMQTWGDWHQVQQGIDVNKCGKGKNNEACSSGQSFTGNRRFICTPRDLATYVHFDALYQAYLNATLILLGMNTPFDPGFAKLSGQRDMFNPAADKDTPQNAGGFALYGGPHILTLVTEVATRALKAVRYQKFNNHLRLRPEALAARMEKATELDKKYPVLCNAFGKMCGQIGDTVSAIKAFNNAAVGQSTALLPMAFAEGSPMHPTYGAGHATVAGACTTIVKAFFDTGTVLGANADASSCNHGKIGFYHNIKSACFYLPPEKPKKNPGKGKRKASSPPPKPHEELRKCPIKCPLTLEGELNKLAANISIGRNMAGVHYFSDYYDSLRMGEQIAIGMLEEQALCYPTDEFVLSIPTFDGDVVRIGAK
ncbi:MAG: vanadium-dependent haloperoxidase [Pseudomonadota bacterium]